METVVTTIDFSNFTELATLWGMRLVSAILILIAGVIVGKWAQRSVGRVSALDDTLRSFLGGFAKYVIIAVAIITVLAQFGVQTASLITVLGAAGLAIGLALQGTLSNVAAGVMLLVLRPFQVGDFIQFGGTGGTVKTLGLFGTELATADNIYVYAPNSKIWNAEIQNFSRNLHRRQDILVGISYGDDIETARQIIRNILEKEERVLETEGKEPKILVTQMADFSVNLTVRLWSLRTDYLELRADLHRAIKEAFDKKGITIPFPTRTLLVEEGDIKPGGGGAKKKSASAKSSGKKTAAAKKSSTKKTSGKKAA